MSRSVFPLVGALVFCALDASAAAPEPAPEKPASGPNVADSPAAGEAKEVDQSDAASERIALAQAEFDKGLEHFRDSRFKPACEHFQRSYELDPLPGVLFTWATCEARDGRVVTSHRLYGEFRELVRSLPVEDREKQDLRLKVSKDEQQKLKAEFPLLRVRVHLNEESEYQIFLDETELETDSLDERRPVDPGEHWLRLKSEGQLVEERRVYLRLRDDVLVGMGRPTMRRAEPVEQAPAAEPKEQPRKPWLYAAAGTAAVGFSVGGVLGIVAASKKGRMDCDGAACNGPDATSQAKSAQNIANVSTAFFVVGGVAAAATAVIYFWPTGRAADSKSDLALGIGPSSVQLAGRF